MSLPVPMAVGRFASKPASMTYLLLTLLVGCILPQQGILHADARTLARRDNTPTDVCKRWSQQTAVVNGTLYIYGGRSTTDANQKDKTWNDNFLTLDLKSSWGISAPKLTGLPRGDNGPPPVSNGYLWNSYSSLFLYGGEFSDNPPKDPVDFSLWEYSIPSSSWIEHKSPTTSSGENASPENIPVQRSAEGAGINVPDLGRGWYFGGHLDGYTTKGWSQSIPRVYLKSMIEYTFPGYTNNGVKINTDDKRAGPEGVWRNITEGGLQDSAGFTERADGVLVYIPGFGKEGIILGLAGGTNATFTQMNVIDVFDIASSKWYKQATSGKTPKIRVNPCAVAASAADGSSTQVYLFGGQNLIPYGEQIQYNDMWILSIPSFTWIEAKTDGQSVPPARAGHTCNIWNSQIVVTGGYVGQDLSCDSPGIYVFDASELTWNNQYTALKGGNDLNQQASQTRDGSGLGGSYGYRVPKVVQSVIGGDDTGKATQTIPAVAPTDGPLATGQPLIYTVLPTSTSGPHTGKDDDENGPNIAAIIAGVIAGCLGVLAIYLGFVTWLYRRRLAIYKSHLAATQRSSIGSYGDKISSFPPRYSDHTSSSNVLGITGSTGNLTTTTSTRMSWMGGDVQGHHHTRSSSGGNFDHLGQPGPSASSSVEDLLAGQEPTFLGVMLNPRQTLRVINQ
ncbi:kelch repeat protein [Nannizzia gypsea CBS 118893]|uniref:Kelch repeat protein n=1 Tax=Arthroderma gypseum (strain ATCC MYA-4604 / CBS 118893) TaxID=535722 RepID=E5R0T9_ARTGP|nr:kelch repeat protein [Nannizzia gypsea CBS 118893]EFQ97595.1 kelch repeat protein [Nannizzia gypsea CBS 118893]